MKLTDIERIQLINQYMILEKLYPEDVAYYSKLREALEQGFTSNYGDVIGELWEEVSEEQCQEVRDILRMYRSITFSLSELREVKKDQGITDKDIRFKGFDLNEDIESKYLRYTRYYIHTLGGYRELKQGNFDFNSHWPLLDTYRRMLSEWDKMNRATHLTADQIKLLINV